MKGEVLLMVTNVDQLFFKFIYNRTVQIGSVLVSSNQEYMDLSKKSSECYEQIKSYLPDEAKHLLCELDESLNRLQGIAEDYLYLQGIKDGFKLNNFLTGPQ